MDEYESALALTRAWSRTNNARQQAKRWQAKAERAEKELRGRAAQLAAADALVEAVIALPEVVKTKELRRALSRYRRARG